MKTLTIEEDRLDHSGLWTVFHWLKCSHLIFRADEAVSGSKDTIADNFSLQVWKWKLFDENYQTWFWSSRSMSIKKIYSNNNIPGWRLSDDETVLSRFFKSVKNVILRFVTAVGTWFHILSQYANHRAKVCMDIGNACICVCICVWVC